MDQGVSDRRGREAGQREAEEVAAYGVPYRALDRGALIELEPNVGEAAIGGVHFSDPLTTPNPTALAKAYADHFVAQGGRLVKGDATTLSPSGEGWQVATEGGIWQAREAVLALGPWTDRWRARSAMPSRLASSVATTCTTPRSERRRR